MNLYRVCCSTFENSSQGFSWHTSKERAQSALKEFQRCHLEDQSTIERVTIALTKDGVMTALRKYASHPDNG